MAPEIRVVPSALNGHEMSIFQVDAPRAPAGLQPIAMTSRSKSSKANSSPAPHNPAAGDSEATPLPSTVKGRSIRIELGPGHAPVQVPWGTTADEVIRRAGITAPYPIVAVRFRNKVAPLDRHLEQAGLLEPITTASRDGALIYRRSLTFVLIVAVSQLFPDLRIYINHSFNQGYYAEVYNSALGGNEPVSLSDSDIAAIARRMHEIIASNMPITRREHPLEEAIAIFEGAGLNDKADLLRYSPPGPVSVYQLGDRLNHFYGQLAPSTGALGVFELQLAPPGFVLRFPRTSRPNELPPSVSTDKTMGVLREYERWLRILQWRTVSQLNALVEADKVREYILIAEALHEKRLGAIADMITNHPRHPRILLLSGPSASGKTTSSKRLSIQLRVNGFRPTVIELDNFFVDREKTPRDENGDFDFESFGAIDVECLQECVRGLLRGEAVRMPKFDFKAGRSVPGEEVRLEPNQLLLLEGIHALNDRLLPTIPDGLKFKIYASPMTHLNIDDHNRISSSDARLLRRLVRDSSYRGYDATATLSRWPSVRRGEEKNIFPYQENADAIFNSALPYEIATLKEPALAVLQRVPREHPEYSEAARLIKFLSYFKSIESDLVPRHSLLREFIGGSCFTY